MYKTAVADDKTSGPVPRRGAWMFICFVCVPVPAWHLLKTITKALHSKALLGGPWQQPHVPDYTNVCQRTPSTCKRLLSTEGCISVIVSSSEGVNAANLEQNVQIEMTLSHFHLVGQLQKPCNKIFITALSFFKKTAY